MKVLTINRQTIRCNFYGTAVHCSIFMLVANTPILLQKLINKYQSTLELNFPKQNFTALKINQHVLLHVHFTTHLELWAELSIYSITGISLPCSARGLWNARFPYLSQVRPTETSFTAEIQQKQVEWKPTQIELFLVMLCVCSENNSNKCPLTVPFLLCRCDYFSILQLSYLLSPCKSNKLYPPREKMWTVSVTLSERQICSSSCSTVCISSSWLPYVCFIMGGTIFKLSFGFPLQTNLPST